MSLITLLSSTSFTPASLFASGEQGVWYDPSDLSTLFTDVAGTTRVTAAGQAVALMLDKSGRGNHATQSVLAARPIYAVVPRTGRRNLLTYTEQFDNAAWNKRNGSVASAGTYDGASVWEFTSGAAGTVTGVDQDLRGLLTSSGASSVVTIRFVVKTSDWRYVQVFTENEFSFSNFDLQTLAVTSGAGTITDLGGGFAQVSHPTTTTGASFAGICLIASGGAARKPAFTGGAGQKLSITRAQFELGSTATPYQRVVSQYDVSEAGVEPLHYLSFDGTDDSMATSAINFSATDAVSVFAGVRKASDTARGTIAELTATIASNNGGFHLTAPNAASDTFAFESKGTALTDAVATGIAAPATRILSGLADISADSNILRVNGAQADADTGDQGTGNYANAVLYVGRRASTSLPFNGSLYGLVIRGAASSDAQIRNAEAWLARRTGVTLA